MTTEILIFTCILLLLAYIFEISSPLTRIPSVILLLGTGWLLKKGAQYAGLSVPDLNPLLGILGTVGLILIVLEGALELEITKDQRSLILKSFTSALLPMGLIIACVAWAFSLWSGSSLHTSVINVIPLAIISSAIAIPASKMCNRWTREFVIYESSISDIAGILLFNLFTLYETINGTSLLFFALNLIIMVALSVISVIGLSLLLGRLNHKVTFTPILLIIILIYALCKMFHLPGLIFILAFGLAAGNLGQLRHWKLIRFFRPEKLETEIAKFREVTHEATFLVRSVFFLTFGFLLKTESILNTDSLPLSGAILVIIFFFRFITLKILRTEMIPLTFIAPRGLITILLFLQIPADQSLAAFSHSVIIQVILMSAFLMMLGIMFTKKEKPGIKIPENNS